MRLLLLITLTTGYLLAQPGDWRSYGQNPQGWRYSELNQINTQNVSRLSPEWIFQTGVAGRFQSVPLVFDQQMYITGPSNHAFALDALTGKQVWHTQRRCPRVSTDAAGNRTGALRLRAIYCIK